MKRLWLALLFACAPRTQIVLNDAIDQGALLDKVHAAQAQPKFLTCTAKAAIEAPQNGGRFTLHLAVARPGSLRVEALNPVGDPALVMVTANGRFALRNLRDNTFEEGPSTPESLGRFLPVPVRPEILVSLITGELPELPLVSAKRDGDGVRLEMRADDLDETATLDGELRLISVELRRKGEVQWTASLAHYSDETGARVPLEVQLAAPLAKTRVELRLRVHDTAEPPPASAFTLAQPK